MRHRATAPLWLRVLAGAVGGLLAAVFVFILCSSIQALYEGRGLDFFQGLWNPQAGKFGIAAMIHASFVLSLSALTLGWLLSAGCCFFLHGVGPRHLAKILLSVLRFMTAIPTVVYGFAAVFLLTPIIREALGGSGFCWLAAGVMLALQGIPTMTFIMNEAFDSIRRETRLTAAALGMTPVQNLTRVIFPQTRPWLVSAAALGFGRALGDTMLPVMLAGNATQFASSPLDSLRTLTAHISLVLSSDIGGGEHLSLLLAGGMLLTGSTIASLIARRFSGNVAAHGTKL